jgi:hypothetical protein
VEKSTDYKQVNFVFELKDFQFYLDELRLAYLRRAEKKYFQIGTAAFRQRKISFFFGEKWNSTPARTT